MDGFGGMPVVEASLVLTVQKRGGSTGADLGHTVAMTGSHGPVCAETRRDSTGASLGQDC